MCDVSNKDLMDRLDAIERTLVAHIRLAARGKIAEECLPRILDTGQDIPTI